MRAVVAEIVRAGMDRKGAGAHIKSWVQLHIERADRERVREIVETELLSLHEGNFARYQLRPAEFADWQDTWMRGKEQ